VTLGHTSTAVANEVTPSFSATTTIASFLVGAYFAEPDWQELDLRPLNPQSDIR
jgi:hypothetical protein